MTADEMRARAVATLRLADVQASRAPTPEGRAAALAAVAEGWAYLAATIEAAVAPRSHERALSAPESAEEVSPGIGAPDEQTAGSSVD